MPLQVLLLPPASLDSHLLLTLSCLRLPAVLPSFSAPFHTCYTMIFLLGYSLTTSSHLGGLGTCTCHLPPLLPFSLPPLPHCTGISFHTGRTLPLWDRGPACLPSATQCLWTSRRFSLAALRRTGRGGPLAACTCCGAQFCYACHHQPAVPARRLPGTSALGTAYTLGLQEEHLHCKPHCHHLLPPPGRAAVPTSPLDAGGTWATCATLHPHFLTSCLPPALPCLPPASLTHLPPLTLTSLTTSASLNFLWVLPPACHGL